MCGILGMIGTRWREEAERALATLRPRGPDEQSVLHYGEATLAHTRLAVIDPQGGHQPMRSPDGRYTIVFNGEIYDFAVLRTELEALGFAFATRSDTEVLLHGYAAWGKRILDRLDGMFAFAIWDAQEKRLFAARDRLGIKPLMYALIDGGLVFASTLAPFFALTGFPRRLDAEALRDYLAFQTPLAPHTFLQAVRQLPPAHWIEYSAAKGNLVCERYWSIPQPTPYQESFDALVEHVDRTLRESVRRQLVADVPLGAFLSGGIDSSLIVHYMAEAGHRPIKTFSLRFSEEAFDETPHARAVASRYATEHHELEAPAINGEAFAAAIQTLDQPLADPAYVMTHALAHLTKRHVTVALSGDGGDELFCGYARYLDEESQHARRFWQPWLRWAIERGLAPKALLRRSLWGRELLHYRRVELGPWPGRKDLTRLLAPELKTAAKPERTLGLWLALIDELGGRMDSSTLMRADLWTYLSENCLVKTDRASMAHGLEVRVPMLGQPVLDAALALPASLHCRGGGKALLKEIARRHLPATVWDRPKHGFSVPLDRLFRTTWRATCEATLAEAGHLAPFLDATAVRKVWSEALSHRASRRLAYTLVVLLVWLKTHPLEP